VKIIVNVAFGKISKVALTCYLINERGFMFDLGFILSNVD
jgi:hypothetical protein